MIGTRVTERHGEASTIVGSTSSLTPMAVNKALPPICCVVPAMAPHSHEGDGRETPSWRCPHCIGYCGHHHGHVGTVATGDRDARSYRNTPANVPTLRYWDTYGVRRTYIHGTGQAGTALSNIVDEITDFHRHVTWSKAFKGSPILFLCGYFLRPAHNAECPLAAGRASS